MRINHQYNRFWEEIILMNLKWGDKRWELERTFINLDLTQKIKTRKLSNNKMNHSAKYRWPNRILWFIPVCYQISKRRKERRISLSKKIKRKIKNTNTKLLKILLLVMHTSLHVHQFINSKVIIRRVSYPNKTSSSKNQFKKSNLIQIKILSLT